MNETDLTVLVIGIGLLALTGLFYLLVFVLPVVFVSDSDKVRFYTGEWFSGNNV